MTEPDLYYCYGVTRAVGEQPDGPGGPAGVAGSTVEFVPVTGDGVNALVSRVPPSEFDEAALRANLERLPWLDTVARTHDGVIAWAAGLGPTLPFRLATVYREESRLRVALDGRAAALTAALDQVDGRVELGLKVYAVAGAAEPDDTTDAAGASAESAPDDQQPGRAYLRRRLGERRDRDLAWNSAVEGADRADRSLSELADDRRQHRPQDPNLSGVPEPNVRNVAYLVHRDRVEEFLSRVDALRECLPSCRLVITGPWAPYSFVPESD